MFLGGVVIDLTETVLRPDVIPLASERGGLWFYRGPAADELHAMFTPEGWGREAAAAFKAAYEHMIGLGAFLFRVTELHGSPNSRPPRSHGWRLAGPYAPGPFGLIARPWTLTVADWRASPAYRRLECRNS